MKTTASLPLIVVVAVVALALTATPVAGAEVEVEAEQNPSWSLPMTLPSNLGATRPSAPLGVFNKVPPQMGALPIPVPKPESLRQKAPIVRNDIIKLPYPHRRSF